MPLPVGARLGPYEIQSALGAGAMGEVYRARDTRLGRDVAVKVLPPDLARDAQALARFEREARAVAALSHPNIVALYDIGTEQGVFIVTELLEGQTLRDRLHAGALPPRKALEFAAQMAAGLAAAHERGVVHRDLKPENVFVTADGRIKLLDFGLAQIPAAPLAAAGRSVAQTTVGTTPGMVLGTLGYMAPEQVRGQSVDARADIFALGAVLYEMVTGARAFAGETPADTISAILHRDPPPVAAASGVTIAPQIDRLVRRCLEKSPGDRFQSARDLMFAIEAMATGSSPGSPERGYDGEPNRNPERNLVVSGVSGTKTALTAIGLAIVLAAAAFVAGRRTAPAPASAAAPAARFGIPTSMGWFDAVSVSPDGRYIVYTGGSETSGTSGFTGLGDVFRSSGFWLRRTDAIEVRRLPDTESAMPLFFWSPDSRSVGYITGNALMVREVPDGTARRIAEVPGRAFGAAWGPSDIVVATTGGLYRLAPTGGPLRLFVATDPSRDTWRGWPSFLPDGRLLYGALTRGNNEEHLETHAATLDGRDLGTVFTGGVGATYADGHLLYGSHGALYAQPFDAAHLKTVGERVQIAPSVAQDWRSGLLVARASDNGVLVFRVASQSMFQFTWFDREGRRLGTVGAPGAYINFDVSPDGRRVIAARQETTPGRQGLWMIDIERGVTSLVTDRDDAEDADDPTWTADGARVAFRHGPKLVIRSPNGGEEQMVVDAEAYPDSFSRDGRYISYGRARGNLYEAWALDVKTPGAKPILLVMGVTLSDETRFSPNGRWVAYHANQTGAVQVHVIPFPPTGESWQISTAGGAQPRWSADGQELFYLDGGGRLMSVKMPDSDPRRAAEPKALFNTGLTTVSDALDQFAVVGGRFLLRVPAAGGPDPAAIQVVVNWKSR